MVLRDPRWTWAAFIGAIFIGGGNFIAVSFSNMELPPLFGAAVRFAMATVIFFGIARLWRVPLVRGRTALGAGIYGLLAFGGVYACLYYALLGLSVGTVSLIVAAAPLFTLLIAVAVGQERPTARGFVGSLLVIAGIGVLSAGAFDGGLGAPYLVAAVLGTFCAAASSVLARSLRSVHPVNMNALGMAAGTVLLVLGSLALGEPWVLPGDAQTWLAVGWLVVVGSVGLFQLFLYVVQRWTASATAYAGAGMPVVAVALGVVMLGQPVTTNVIVGGALVLIAVYVGTGARAPRPVPTQASSAVEAVDPVDGGGIADVAPRARP